MTKPQPRTPDEMLGRTPAFVKAQLARLEKVKKRSRLRKKATYTLDDLKAVSGLAVTFSAQAREKTDADRYVRPREVLRPRMSHAKWTAESERWWLDKVAAFPGGVCNAVWHMPEAAVARMQWLERKVRAKS